MGGGTEVISDGVTETVRKYYALAAPLAALGGAPLRYASSTFGMSDNGVMKYLISDHLGSTVAITDNTGNVFAETRYMPFGEPRADAGSLAGTDKTFTGQRDVPDTGWMDYRARNYSPGLGRFIQPDTIVPGAGNSQAWNRYGYVLGNPIIYSDPSGHSLDCAIGEKYCQVGKYSPLGLVALAIDAYGSENIVQQGYIPGTENNKQKNLAKDIEDYLVSFSDYDVKADPLVVRRNGAVSYINYFAEIRLRYWMTRTHDINFVKANNLYQYYDLKSHPSSIAWDGTRIDWGNVALDVVNTGASLIGLNSVSNSLKLSSKVQNMSLAVSNVTGGISLGKSISEGDGGGIVLGVLGYSPGLFGVAFSGLAVANDLLAGFYEKFYQPDVPRY